MFISFSIDIHGEIPSKQEGASMGGIFSWALEPNSVSFGEGFEVRCVKISEKYG